MFVHPLLTLRKEGEFHTTARQLKLLPKGFHQYFNQEVPWTRAPAAADTKSTIQRTLTNFREPFDPEKQQATWLR